MNFTAELKKLIKAEQQPLRDPLSELASAQAALLENIQKDNSDLSLQVEEIYDIIKTSDDNAKKIFTLEKRENLLLSSMISLNNLIDDLLPYIQDHAMAVSAKREEAINACDLEQTGFIGERFDPKLHTAASAEFNEAMFETIIRVLENGYTYHGKVLKKAVVILSKGVKNE